MNFSNLIVFRFFISIGGESISVFLFLFLAVSVITDIQTGKIPNWLILSGLAVGICTTDHFFQDILLVLFSILIFFPLFLLGTLGAGDVKAILVLGFYLTARQLAMAIFYSFLLGAVYGICKMLRLHSFFQGMHKIPLAPFICLGVLISIGGTYL